MLVPVMVLKCLTAASDLDDCLLKGFCSVFVVQHNPKESGLVATFNSGAVKVLAYCEFLVFSSWSNQ